MKSFSPTKHEFPMEFPVKGRTIALRPLRASDRQGLVEFARSLPVNDLLFLERDITQEAEVDWWIRQSAAGSLFTIVAAQDETIIAYATFQRGNVRWTAHVAELRVVVGPSARGIGIGRLLLELIFEMALQEGVTKLMARMTPGQSAAVTLFERLGFEHEAVLRDHAKDANGITHDLLVLSYRTRLHPEQGCDVCGVPVLTALTLDGSRLCSQCYEQRYQELGGGA